jgi:hypothetical protein
VLKQRDARLRPKAPAGAARPGYRCSSQPGVSRATTGLLVVHGWRTETIAENSGAIPNRIPARDARCIHRVHHQQLGKPRHEERERDERPDVAGVEIDPDANAVAGTSTNAIVAITAEPALTSATRVMPRRIVMFNSPRNRPATRAKRTPVTELARWSQAQAATRAGANVACGDRGICDLWGPYSVERDVDAARVFDHGL